MRPTHNDSSLNKNIMAPTMHVCYGQSEMDASNSPLCHVQHIKSSDKCKSECPPGKGWINSQAVLTPCYDYNIYFEVTSKTNNATIRSLPKAVTTGKIK